MSSTSCLVSPESGTINGNLIEQSCFLTRPSNVFLVSLQSSCPKQTSSCYTPYELMWTYMHSFGSIQMRYIKLVMSFLEFLVKSMTCLGLMDLDRFTIFAASFNEAELNSLLENARVFPFHSPNFQIPDPRNPVPPRRNASIFYFIQNLLYVFLYFNLAESIVVQHFFPTS